MTARRWDDSVLRRAVPGLADQLDQTATTGDVIALITDADGRVLWQSTPLWLRRGAERIGLVPGGLWHEASMGTNGIGLALAADRPASVFSTEHWVDPVRDWVCYAAPIHAPDGTQVGAIDLSTKWKHANPLALSTVASMARLVEHELRNGPHLFGPAAPALDVRVLGEAAATLGGVPLHLTLRQFEILTILAVNGGATLGELHALLYGDRPVAPTTLKAEISHLRRALDGRLASRPYRLDLPFRIDANELPERLERGDVDGAARLYAGQLLPASEAPFVVELRHELDVALRTALLRAGTTAAVMRFTDRAPLRQRGARADRHPRARRRPAVPGGHGPAGGGSLVLTGRTDAPAPLGGQEATATASSATSGAPAVVAGSGPRRSRSPKRRGSWVAGAVVPTNSRSSVDEAVVIGVVREVPGAREDLEPAARHRLVGTVGVRHGDDAVAVAPDDQRRHGLGQVAAVEQGHDLAPPVDDRPQGARERDLRLAVGEAGEHAIDVAPVVREIVVRQRQGARARPGRAAGPPGHRAGARNTSASGAAASRRIGVTSRPTPPLATSTRRSHRSGYWYASWAATPPPSEWPTTVADSMPSTVNRSRMPLA